MLDRDFRCKGCNYRLKGIPSGPCPECGRLFDWNRRTTFRAADEQRQAVALLQTQAKRIAVLAAVVLVGLLPALAMAYGFVAYDGPCCCCTVLAFPVWLVACVVALLACISPSGWLGTAGCILVGGAAAALFALPAGLPGLFVAVPAGMIGGLVFKHMELNNFI
jgi:hypothetical protein